MIRLLQSLFRQVPDPPAEPVKDDMIWCLVGNLKSPPEVLPDGTPGKSNHLFRAGQRIYVLRASRKGRFHRLLIVGRHRGNGRFIVSWLRTHKIENWRAKAIYSPNLVWKLKKKGAVWQSKEQVEGMAEWLNSADPKEFLYLPDPFMRGPLKVEKYVTWD